MVNLTKMQCDIIKKKEFEYFYSEPDADGWMWLGTKYLLAKVNYNGVLLNLPEIWYVKKLENVQGMVKGAENANNQRLRLSTLIIDDNVKGKKVQTFKGQDFEVAVSMANLQYFYVKKDELEEYEYYGSGQRNPVYIKKFGELIGMVSPVVVGKWEDIGKDEYR